MSTRRQFIGAGVSTAALIAARRALAQAGDLTALSIAEQSALIRAREISSIDLTSAYLSRIERFEPAVNAYVRVTAALALEQASQLDAELDDGRWRGPLHGIPIALKDNIDTAGIHTTAASSLLADRVPDRDADVYRRLKQAGTVLLGKLNMHEFAYGGTSAITAFGPVRNPWNLEHIPGGSSGGSAAAASARLCAASLGTDTLASIRQPASYCGVTGFKATHGLASIRGIVPVAESLDHVGPLARSAADCGLILDAIAGYDSADPMSLDVRLPSFASAVYRRTDGLRIGIPEHTFFERLHPDVEAATAQAVTTLGDLTGVTQRIALPETPDFALLLAEGYAYHEQFLSDPANHDSYDSVTLERLLAAGNIPASDYIAARRALELARNEIALVFNEVDLLITPTAPALPERIDSAQNPAEASGAEPSVRNTAPFNLYGIPTISIPCGFSASGLPIGLQISGPALGELDVIALAHAYQQVTDWHRREPPLV